MSCDLLFTVGAILLGLFFVPTFVALHHTGELTNFMRWLMMRFVRRSGCRGCSVLTMNEALSSERAPTMNAAVRTDDCVRHEIMMSDGRGGEYPLTVREISREAIIEAHLEQYGLRIAPLRPGLDETVFEVLVPSRRVSSQGCGSESTSTPSAANVSPSE